MNLTQILASCVLAEAIATLVLAGVLWKGRTK